MSPIVELAYQDVVVRVLKTKDTRALEHLLSSQRSWLAPWEATYPGGPRELDVRGLVKSLLKQLRENSTLPMVIEYRGEIVGQLNVANMLYGSVSSGTIGYWISKKVAGNNITTTAVALVTDYLFQIANLHRVEIDIRPENIPSLRVVEKLGFRYEGFRKAFIHIDGDWRDHYSFALVREDVPQGVLNRWKSGDAIAPNYP